eukprot:SAG31_NODE_2825_length_5038_cov_2.170277_6_plen_94_part_00
MLLDKLATKLLRCSSVAISENLDQLDSVRLTVKDDQTAEERRVTVVLDFVETPKVSTIRDRCPDLESMRPVGNSASLQTAVATGASCLLDYCV